MRFPFWFAFPPVLSIALICFDDLDNSLHDEHLLWLFVFLAFSPRDRNT